MSVYVRVCEHVCVFCVYVTHKHMGIKDHTSVRSFGIIGGTVGRSIGPVSGPTLISSLQTTYTLFTLTLTPCE